MTQQATPRPRILVVEDEALVSILIEEIIEDMGLEVAAVAIDYGSAERMTRELDFDAAILDVNLRGRLTFALADALTERGIPFIFATGYDAGQIPDRFSRAPKLQKPFRVDDFERTLKSAMPSREPTAS